MKTLSLVAAIALAAPVFLAHAKETEMTHKSGEKTTVKSDRDGSKISGWHGGEGGVSSRDSHEKAVKEVKEAGRKHDNPVVKTTDR